MQLDVIQYAEQGRSIEKRISVATIPKLEGLIANTDRFIDVRLAFSVGEQGIPQVQGQVSGELELICQRCMSPMAFNLFAEIELVLVQDSLADAVQSRFDLNPFVYDAPHVSLPELVSDDIILNLPLVARHPDSQCSSVVTFSTSSDHDEMVRAQSARRAPRASPFSVLKNMINTDRSS